MSTHYDEAYFRSGLDMSDAAFALVSRLRAQKIQPYVGASDKVFEYGVGTGLNIALLNCGVRHGYDINQSSNAETRKHGIELINPTRCEAGTYDVVICHHVLEHLLDPAECLKEIIHLLRRNGKLLLFVPYEEQRRFRKHISKDLNHHLYSWTPHTLSNLIIECGFSLRSAGVGRFGYDRFCARLAVKFSIGNVGYRFIRRCAHLLRPEREVIIVAERP